MTNRAEIEQKVTDSIIRALESGVAPWRKPWDNLTLPVSVATNKPYRGINTLILWAVQTEMRYERPYWLTLKQANAMGGTVRKGEKSTEIVFWKVHNFEKRDEETGLMVPAKVPLLRTYRVFNVEQCDGLELPPRYSETVKVHEPVEVLEGLQTVMDGYVDGPTVVNLRGNQAFYMPLIDIIQLPERNQFPTPEGYAETMLHELVHSTGHKDRLDRFEAGQERFGCEGYAREELVAEIGAAMLAAVVGIDLKVEQTAAYVGSWLKALKDDRSLIIKAAQQAQKAVDRILPAQETAAVKEEAEATA